MFSFIKRYFHKANQEMKKDYAFSTEEELPINPNHWDYANPEDLESSLIPWVGVDLDGTLAYYEHGKGIDSIGQPVPFMADLVRKMINDKVRVKIFTARACDPDQFPLIKQWLFDNGFPELEITNVKDYQMMRLYDDRCIQVEHNTGLLIADNLNNSDV